MLNKKLENEDLVYDALNLRENPEMFKKYNVRTTPVLVILDNDLECDRLTSVDEIVEFLKNEQNIEIPLGR